MMTPTASTERGATEQESSISSKEQQLEADDCDVATSNETEREGGGKEFIFSIYLARLNHTNLYSSRMNGRWMDIDDG
jgi:hypothetical protein